MERVCATAPTGQSNDNIRDQKDFGFVKKDPLEGFLGRVNRDRGRALRRKDHWRRRQSRSEEEDDDFERNLNRRRASGRPGRGRRLRSQSEEDYDEGGDPLVFDHFHLPGPATYYQMFPPPWNVIPARGRPRNGQRGPQVLELANKKVIARLEGKTPEEYYKFRTTFITFVHKTEASVS